MQTDANLLFTGGSTGAAQAITSSAVGSTGILDLATGLMNTGSTYAAAGLNIGNASIFAEDLGVGPRRLQFAAAIGTAFTTGGTSLTIAIQGAVDAASGSYPANLSGLTWTTYAETNAIPAATLVTAGPGAIIPLPDWPVHALGLAMPRFIRLLYTPVGTLVAGTIAYAGLFMPRSDNKVGLYPGGFSVGA